VAVLIAQDLGVVGMVLVVPLLGPAGEGGSGTGSLVGAVLTAVAIVLLVARRLMPAVLDVAARACSPEVFLLTVVAVCFGTAYLAALASVSVSLGAFLARLVVSASRASTHALAKVLPLQQRARESAEQVAETLTNTLGDHLRTNIDGVRTLLLDVTRPPRPLDGASACWSLDWGSRFSSTSYR
jgi:Kef-type K+ transport system membrane component KefB